MHALPPCAGEFAFWLGPSVDVLPYYGPVAARAVMHDHELWLHPSSLEGRGLPRPSLQDRVRGRAGWAPWHTPSLCTVGSAGWRLAGARCVLLARGTGPRLRHRWLSLTALPACPPHPGCCRSPSLMWS